MSLNLLGGVNGAPGPVGLTGKQKIILEVPKIDIITGTPGQPGLRGKNGAAGRPGQRGPPGDAGETGKYSKKRLSAFCDPFVLKQVHPENKALKESQAPTHKVLRPK